MGANNFLLAEYEIILLTSIYIIYLFNNNSSSRIKNAPNNIIFHKLSKWKQ